MCEIAIPCQLFILRGQWKKYGKANSRTILETPALDEANIVGYEMLTYMMIFTSYSFPGGIRWNQYICKPRRDITHIIIQHFKLLEFDIAK